MPRLHSPPGMQARTVRVRVRGGYEPAEVHGRAGEPLRVVFCREETASCSEHVVFPAFGKSAMLPPFEQVTVELLPERAGEYEFTCRSGVLRGLLVVSDGEQETRGGRRALTAQRTRRKAQSTTVEGPRGDTALLAGVVWLCGLPLVLLVAVPFLGWRAGAVLALAWLAIAAVACFAVCAQRMEPTRATRALGRRGGIR